MITALIVVKDKKKIKDKSFSLCLILQVQHSTQSGPFSLHREKSSLSHLTAWQPSWPVDNETEILRGASRKRQKRGGGRTFMATDKVK